MVMSAETFAGAGGFLNLKGTEMDPKTEDRDEPEDRGKAVQEDLDKIPPPGTDPLHEGP